MRSEKYSGSSTGRPVLATSASSARTATGAAATTDRTRPGSRSASTTAARTSAFRLGGRRPRLRASTRRSSAVSGANNASAGGPSPSGLPKAYRAGSTRVSAAPPASRPRPVRFPSVRSTSADRPGSSSRATAARSTPTPPSAASTSTTCTVGRSSRRSAERTAAGSASRSASSDNASGTGARHPSGRRSSNPVRPSVPRLRSQPTSTTRPHLRCPTRPRAKSRTMPSPLPVGSRRRAWRRRASPPGTAVTRAGWRCGGPVRCAGGWSWWCVRRRRARGGSRQARPGAWRG